jgi:hypothetical protein
MKGGSTVFDAPLLAPMNSDPPKTVAQSTARIVRIRRVVTREEMSDIATE